MKSFETLCDLVREMSPKIVVKILDKDSEMRDFSPQQRGLFKITCASWLCRSLPSIVDYETQSVVNEEDSVLYSGVVDAINYDKSLTSYQALSLEQQKHFLRYLFLQYGCTEDVYKTRLVDLFGRWCVPNNLSGNTVEAIHGRLDLYKSLLAEHQKMYGKMPPYVFQNFTCPRKTLLMPLTELLAVQKTLYELIGFWTAVYLIEVFHNGTSATKTQALAEVDQLDTPAQNCMPCWLLPSRDNMEYVTHQPIQNIPEYINFCCQAVLQYNVERTQFERFINLIIDFLKKNVVEEKIAMSLLETNIQKILSPVLTKEQLTDYILYVRSTAEEMFHRDYAIINGKVRIHDKTSLPAII